MANRALLSAVTGAAAMEAGAAGDAPGSVVPTRKTKCLRANFAMGVSAIGAIIAVVFALMAKNGSEGTGSTGLFICAVVFAILLVMAWFQRSLERQILRFSEENDELRATRNRFDEENKEFDAANKELQKTRDRLDQENKELDAANDRHEKLIDKQEAELKKLNKLYNDSVNMVRQLAMFGDECKELGHDLKDVAGDLKETDDSLGLTADELRKQTEAIAAATAALTRVADTKGSSTS